jgi:preprotein translocase subunit SecB
MQCAFLLNVVVAQRAAVFKLFAGKDEALLIGWDTFFVLNFGFDVFDGIRGFDFECDGLAGERFHENLHTTAETEHQMKCALLLDVVVAQCAAVFQLLAGKDEALLIGWDTFFVLDFGFDIFDRVRGFDFQRDGLAGERFDENLHATAETKHQVEGAFCLDVVVAECTTVFKLLAGKDEALLIGRDAFFVLDFGFDIVDGITGLDLECDGLAGESLDENLHTTAQTKDEVECAFFLDVVVAECTTVFELFVCS